MSSRINPELHPDNVRARFHDLREQERVFLPKLEAAQAAHDAKRNELMERERTELQPLIDALLPLKEQHHAMQMEMALCSRALAGKTGPKPGTTQS